MNPIYHSPGHTLCLSSKLMLCEISERLFLQPMNAAYTETTFRLVWRMAVHRVYPDTADSCDHAHQRPRTLFPPTVQRARTVHALFALLLAEALHTHARDWWSVATRLCVLWVLLFFFFFPFPLLLFTPHVLHTQLREKGASQRKDDLNPIGTGSSSGNRRLFVLNWLQKQKRDIKIFYSSVPSRKFNEMDSLEVRQFY